MENTREKNKRSDGRKKTYFDRENKKKAVRIEKTKSVAPEKGKQKKSSSSSKCPYQKKCGGCTYLNLSYEEQLAKKEQFLKKTLKGIVPVKGMVGMENPYHYRNKVNSAFARKKDGTIISGIYEKGTLFMGGKIIAYNKITKYAERLAESQHATGMQDLILQTDQIYWQIISLVNKKKLAENFLELVQKLDSDVDKMIKEGVATKADGLSVKVKVNEAEMMLTQVDNGLNLSKMLLCQLCGLPLETDFQLADESMKDLPLPNTYTEANVSTALSNREELKSLELASEIYRQKVNVVRADFLPSVALTANYLVTNPSLVNGFENKFRGMWAAGIVVKIPVFHWGEGIYKVKAAKAEANIARYKLEDIKEKVELQVTQNSYKVNESTKKLALAEKNMEKAEENLRYANLGFKEGVIPTSNVLEAQTAWFSAQAGKIDAQIDVKMSELYLNKSMGILK